MPNLSFNYLCFDVVSYEPKRTFLLPEMHFVPSLFSLLGADYEPYLQSFSVDVTVGEFTSNELVSSTPA